MERIPNDGCYTRYEKRGLNQDVPSFCEDDPDILFSITTTVDVIERDRVTKENKVKKKWESFAFCLPCAKVREPRLFQ